MDCPRYSCVICSSSASGVCCHGAEQRMERLARLEIDRAVLDLHEHVGPEPAVQRHEFLVRALGPVGVDGRVVDEGAPQHDAAVRRQRIGQHVGAVVVIGAVVLRAGLAFRICLDLEAAEIRDQPIDFVRLFASTTRRQPGRADRSCSGRPAASARRIAATDTRACRRAETHRPARRSFPGSRRVRLSACALTLLRTAPLMPIDAQARA